jgi:argininosuccinate lyase
VELLLTRRLGDIGKKIHSGRSRNDQVLVDLKLFLKDEVLKLKEEVLALFSTLQKLSEEHRDVLLPGYTHGQVAMPSSFGLWFGAYAEALADDMYMLRGAYNVTDQNPLGSAAGYGSSFPLNRQMTTDLLGFASLDYNVVAAQLSRGKSERAVASAMGAVALTLNKFAADCCMYMSPNYGFIKFPDELTTGSSIMPHKKNPDVWEIMRGNCNRVMACENEISLMCSNMPHGYHRDFQLLKDVLFPTLETMHNCLQMADYMLQHIIIKKNILDAPIYDYLFTVEEVNRRTLEGMPFRDAYKSVGIEVNEGRFRYQGAEDKTNGQLTPEDLKHSSIGSLGNLCNDLIAVKMAKASEF